MRKRKGKYVTFNKKETKPKKTIKSKNKINIVTSFCLIGIFFMILFLTCFFNLNSGTVFNPNGTTLGERFFLSGPDPYLNMRTCEQTLIQGRYPYVSPHIGDYDPLLNYPVGDRGSRPPLFNMIAVFSTSILQNFMTQIDALGWSMLLLPAIYGALLVFPVYGIAKNLFNRKVGIIAALFVALIPIHIGGSHGSTLSLFDHDSFLLLLFTCIFYFIIKSLKEKEIKSLIYSGFAGLFIGAVYLTWTASQFIFSLLLLSLVILLIFDIFKSKYDLKIPTTYTLTFVVAFLISLPWIIIHQDDIIGFPFMCMTISIILLSLYIILKKYKIPWIVSLPTFGVLGGIGLLYLYLSTIDVVPSWGALYQISSMIFGEGIYGSKVSLTVAEAHNFGISQSIMSFGPVLYWVGLTGFLLYLIKSYKEKFPIINIFIITIFFVIFWLTTTAGRFLNDLIPSMAIFSGFCIFLILDKLNFKSLFETFKHTNGLKKFKVFKLRYVATIAFIIFLVIAPNSFLVIDAAVPAETKEQVFWEGYQGAFGNSNTKNIYWVDAYSWLNSQDIEIEKDEDKPAFISWWDYGFQEVAIGHHPTVADNYQVGLYAAGNFKLATTEEEAVSVLIVRCCEGNKVHNDNKLTNKVKIIFNKYFDINNATKLISYIEEPTTCPSYNTLVSSNYGNTVLRVNEQNAMYHDCWKIMQNLTDKEITNLYKDIQEATNYSIRYYGTEQYDTRIFGVFTFLTDRGTQGFVTHEDDYYIELLQDQKTGIKYTIEQINNFTYEQAQNMDLQTVVEWKPLVFDTIWYKTYYGYSEFPEQRMPTFNLKHFKLVYYSPVVVLSKYYEGATITGTVNLNNISYPNTVVYAFDEYGIPHDYGITNQNGSFSLIAPAGNITFKLFVGYNLNYLNQTKTLFITEEEGIQKVDCNKELHFKVDFASTFINIVSNQKDLFLKIKGQTFENDYIEVINNNQTFTLNEIVPDEYEITLTNNEGRIVYNRTEFFYPGVNIFNVTV